MKLTSVGKPSIAIIFLAVFTLILNLVCGMFIIPMFNLWRPTQPNLRILAFKPYQNGSWDISACFSSRASEAYFSRVKKSGAALNFEEIRALGETRNLHKEVRMRVNRGSVDFIEKAVIVNGCIESFQSDPL